MPEGRGAVVAFTDIEDRLRAERVLREHEAILAAQRGVAAAGRDARGRRGGVGGGVRRHRPGGGAGPGRGAGGDLALRTRPAGDRGRRLERSTASVPGRHPLAGRRAHGRRAAPGDRPPREDRGLRRQSRGTIPDAIARDRDPLGGRRRDRRRRRGLGRDGCRCRRRRAPARTTSRIGSPSSRSWSPRRSRTARAETSSPGSPTSRPRCGGSRRWSRAASPPPEVFAAVAR